MFDVIQSTFSAFAQIRKGPWQNLGHVLLVGEGNLSFAKSLLKIDETQTTHMLTTTFENSKDLSDEVLQNAQILKCNGAQVLHNVDATKLQETLKPQKFDTIIFQFPNVGSRDPKHGHNPNHVMIRKFLRSALDYLAPAGRVLISTVDSPHYEGVFKVDEAAQFSGYEPPISYPFDPTMFSGYSHVNTKDKDSALDEHNKFTTWVFTEKE